MLVGNETEEPLPGCTLTPTPGPWPLCSPHRLSLLLPQKPRPVEGGPGGRAWPHARWRISCHNLHSLSPPGQRCLIERNGGWVGPPTPTCLTSTQIGPARGREQEGGQCNPGLNQGCPFPQMRAAEGLSTRLPEKRVGERPRDKRMGTFRQRCGRQGQEKCHLVLTWARA